MATFTALSFVLYLPVFEFWIIPAVPFLKIDFSNTFVMMAGFALGPIAGIIVGVLKELLHAAMSSTFGIGEIANIIIMLPYVLIPSIVYKKHRNIKTVFITLAIGCVLQAVWSIPVNYLLTFPFFMSAFGGSWKGGMDFYLDVWYWAVLFNFVKTVLVSAAVLLLYKQFQRLFNLIFNKDRRKPKERATEEANSGVAPSLTTAEAYDIASPEEMQELGKSIASGLNGGDVVLLSGELGAGKTVFCKGFAVGLGIDTEVSSPTFTIMNEHIGKVKFCHIDAYRLSSADEGEAAGLCDCIGNPDCICAIEWWENIEGLLDGMKTVKIKIEKCEDMRARKVTVER